MNPADAAITAMVTLFYDFATQYDITIAANITCPANARNYQSQVQQVIDSGANVVIAALQAADSPYFLANASRMGVTAPNYLLLGSDVLFSPTITQVNGAYSPEAANGLNGVALGYVQKGSGPQFDAFLPILQSVCLRGYAVRLRRRAREQSLPLGRWCCRCRGWSGSG